MKNIVIVILVVVGVGALIAFVIHKMRQTTKTAEAIHQGVGSDYLELLKSQDFETAYDSCLADSLKADLTQQRFVEQHRARVAEFGGLQSWMQTRYEHEANLFTSESLIGLRYVLSYEKRDIFTRYGVDSSVQPFRIQEFLGSPDTTDSLSPGVW